MKDLDDAILSKIKPFLYNGGRGKIVHLIDLVDNRRNTRELGINKRLHTPKLPDTILKPTEKEQAKMLDGDKALWAKYGDQNFFVCWDMDKRGTVGENIIHICFINATSTDMDLAKRIIMHFPKLVNDIYLSDLFYGKQRK